LISLRAVVRLRAWLANEVRLLGLRDWSGGQYAGPPDPEPFTASDPRCARLIARQVEARERMANRKAGLLDGREVIGDYFHNTNVKATLDAIKRAGEPPIQLVRRKAK
jgi:hypothetical protein